MANPRELRHVSPGDRISASQWNIMVDLLRREITGPNVFSDHSGWHLRDRRPRQSSAGVGNGGNGAPTWYQVLKQWAYAPYNWVGGSHTPAAIADYSRMWKFADVSNQIAHYWHPCVSGTFSGGIAWIDEILSGGEFIIVPAFIPYYSPCPRQGTTATAPLLPKLPDGNTTDGVYPFEVIAPYGTAVSYDGDSWIAAGDKFVRGAPIGDYPAYYCAEKEATIIQAPGLSGIVFFFLLRDEDVDGFDFTTDPHFRATKLLDSTVTNLFAMSWTEQDYGDKLTGSFNTAVVPLMTFGDSTNLESGAFVGNVYDGDLLTAMMICTESSGWAWSYAVADKKVQVRLW